MAMLGMDMSGMVEGMPAGDEGQPPKEEEGVGKKLLKGLLRRGL